MRPDYPVHSCEALPGSKRGGQTTFLLQFPVWWAYGFSLIGAASAAIVGVYVAFARVMHVVTGTVTIIDEGADH